MKLQFAFFAFLFVALLLSSCKKEDPENVLVSPDYPALAVGNYWIYQRFNIDENGVETAQSIEDSCYVEKDTVIDGLTFFKVVRPDPYTPNDVQFLRLDDHYVRNTTGQAIFSSIDFTSLFDEDVYANDTDTIARASLQMVHALEIVEVPAGSFITLNARRRFQFWPGHDNFGVFRDMDTRYADGIGIVVETLPIFSGNPARIERRLVRWHVG